MHVSVKVAGSKVLLPVERAGRLRQHGAGWGQDSGHLGVVATRRPV